MSEHLSICIIANKIQIEEIMDNDEMEQFGKTCLFLSEKWYILVIQKSSKEVCEVSKLSVLVADDSQEFRGILREYIERQDDMEVIDEASNGEETLEKIYDMAPDVVLLDMIMPRVDGLGVLESLHRIPRDICLLRL